MTGSVQTIVTRVLADRDVAQVRELASAAAQIDGVEPLNEASRLRLTQAVSGVEHVLLRDAGGRLLAYGQLEHDAAGGGHAAGAAGAAGELVVAPAARRSGLGSALLARLRAESDGPLRVWAHGSTEAADRTARRAGVAPVRELLRMRRSADDLPPTPELPAGVGLRAFEPGRDAAAWLALNAAAFAGHPEQGRWTQTDLTSRLAEGWFDPGGFFLATRPGGDLVGFHWTKLEPATPGPDGRVGEVYVIGVHPGAQGSGLGQVLLLTGLHHLHDHGADLIELYVEGNSPAVRLYERTGFTVAARDTMYAS